MGHDSRGWREVQFRVNRIPGVQNVFKDLNLGPKFMKAMGLWDICEVACASREPTFVGDFCSSWRTPAADGFCRSRSMAPPPPSRPRRPAACPRFSWPFSPLLSSPPSRSVSPSAPFDAPSRSKERTRERGERAKEGGLPYVAGLARQRPKFSVSHPLLLRKKLNSLAYVRHEAFS